MVGIAQTAVVSSGRSSVHEMARADDGPRPNRPIVVTSAAAPGVTRAYTDWSAFTQDVVDGRVWEGVHFRFSDETAVQVGQAVARHDLRRLWRLGLS